MVIDTSALIAILLVEADRELYIEAIERSEIKLMSAANALEGASVAEARKGAAGGRESGKGNHPAGLNYCNCCALALARVSGHSLLFKSDDLGRTGAPSALGPR